MSALEAALVEVASTLEALSIPYMLIGGLAVSVWGEPRATLDADFSVWVRPDNIGNVVREISARLQSIPPDPMSFVVQSRVLPVLTSSGVRADLVFATLDVEQDLISRAAPKLIGSRSIKVATVEDLIWMKLMSERAKDIEDATLLLRRFAGSLDRTYLEPRLTQISEAFSRADILEIYRREMSS